MKRKKKRKLVKKLVKKMIGKRKRKSICGTNGATVFRATIRSN